MKKIILLLLLSIASYGQSPSGVVTPNYIGEDYFDKLNTIWYTSTGLTNTSWVSAPLTKITGYVSGAGTVSATDTVLQAIQKLNGNQVASGVTSGTYTPTAVAGTNVTSVASPTTHTYTKIGNTVTVYGYTVPTLTTTAIDASYTITLPIARANTGTFAIGFGATDTPANTTKSVFINSSTTTTATIMLTSSLTGGVVCRYSFQYDVTQ